MTDKINGWQPPIICDDVYQRPRVATQRDIDELVAFKEAYAELKTKLYEMDRWHMALVSHLAMIKDAHRK